MELGCSFAGAILDALPQSLFTFWTTVFAMPLWNHIGLRLIGGRGLVAAASIAPEKLWRELLAGNWQIPLLIFGLFALNFLFWSFLWGRWGNRLLFWSLQRKEKAGYFTLPSYRTTERGWMILFISLLLIYCLGGVCVQSFAEALDHVDHVSKCAFCGVSIGVLRWFWDTAYASPKLALLGQLIGTALIVWACFIGMFGLVLSKAVITPLREWNQLRRHRQEEEFLKELEIFSELKKSFQEETDKENIESVAQSGKTETEAKTAKPEETSASTPMTQTPYSLTEKIRSVLLKFLQKN